MSQPMRVFAGKPAVRAPSEVGELTRRLATLARRIDEHRGAIAILERERTELRRRIEPLQERPA